MTRSAIPQPTRAERAARDAAAYAGPVEIEGITRLPPAVCLLIWIAILLALWAGIIALVRLGLS